MQRFEADILKTSEIWDVLFFGAIPGSIRPLLVATQFSWSAPVGAISFAGAIFRADPTGLNKDGGAQRVLVSMINSVFMMINTLNYELILISQYLTAFVIF